MQKDLLQLVLEQKEKRFNARLEYENIYKTPVICFSLNLPYMYKIANISEVKELFLFGINEVLSLENIINYSVNLDELFCLFAIDDEALNIKKLTISLENKYNFSRLFDFDVYFNNETIKLRNAGRKCFLCDELAIVCQRNNTHTKSSIYKKLDELFDDFYVHICINKSIKNNFSKAALKALLYEVSLSPKIGLVDRFSSNSHNDMNFYTFLDSVSELREYFDSFYTLAKLSKRNDFIRLKKIGQIAEKSMFNATNNINTHKGALFLFAIMIFACSKSEDELSLENISKITKDLCVNLCQNELNNNLNSIGGICFQRFGIKGIRDEVEKGFINTFKAFKFYQTFEIKNDISLLKTLFYIVYLIDDTSLIKRLNYNYDNYLQVKNTCLKLSKYDDSKIIKIINKLNNLYSSKNISFGGSADVLSLIIFLNFIKIK
ncbi:triphosphoribosyl-dephospho-CoA synthase [Campylobacter sp. RM12637]|uniref:triphosphoribosyl-dephospho-CoA synthase n=1 Tax=Campylobacter sp. RM12637 TaxID=2735734 RepID=UPI0030155F57|nr:triphosphoribosyl-dephospho-CoA synthase [Campylobacter sp. RM12637]